MKLSKLFTCVICLSLLGCSGTNKPPPDQTKLNNVDDVYQEQLEARIAKVKVVHSSARKLYAFFLNENNKLSYVCHLPLCPYKERETDTVIYSDALGQFSLFTKKLEKENYRCGYGNPAGYLGLIASIPSDAETDLDHIDGFNWTEKNAKYCKNRFFKAKVGASDAVMVTLSAMVTFGTSLLTHGSFHFKHLDHELLKQTIVAANLDNLVLGLSSPKYWSVAGAGYQIVYISEATVEEDLQKAVKLSQQFHTSNQGLLLFNKENNSLIAGISFELLTGDNSMDLLKKTLISINQDLQKAVSYKQDNAFIEQYIPPPIKKPKVPPVPELIKDEFEKQTAFINRVNVAVNNREALLRKMANTYEFEVFKRNEYIRALMHSYQGFLKRRHDGNRSLKRLVYQQQNLLSHLLFNQLYSDLRAEEMQYDAENERLYMNLRSIRNNFQQSVVLPSSPNIARAIKREGDYGLGIDSKLTGSQLVLEKALVWHKGEKMPAQFTDMRYLPPTISVKAQGSVLELNAEPTLDHRKYLQKDTSIVDDIPKHTLYLSIQKQVNLTIPDWFSQPPEADQIHAYGTAESHAKALTHARAELARMVQVRVQSQQSVKVDDNQITTFERYNELTNTSTDVVLTSDQYRINRQEEKEGKWYIELVWLSKET